MRRPLGPEGLGAIWHLTSRGYEHHSIFVDDEDRERFLALQREDRDFARKAEAARKRLRSSPSNITE